MKEFIIKRIESGWLFTLTALFIVAAHYFNIKELFNFFSCAYIVSACSTVIIWFAVINICFNDGMMDQIMGGVVKDAATRSYLQKKMSAYDIFIFLNWPVIIHILCGGYILFIIKNDLLIMSFIAMLFYLRIIYFIVSAGLVTYLNKLDLEDEIKEAALEALNKQSYNIGAFSKLNRDQKIIDKDE